MVGKKQMHYINSQQIGLDSVLWSCMRMSMSNGSMKSVLDEDGNGTTCDTCNKSHSIHMWDILKE